MNQPDCRKIKHLKMTLKKCVKIHFIKFMRPQNKTRQEKALLSTLALIQPSITDSLHIA